MNYGKGQSLVELLIAMGVFVLVVSVITWLVLDVYLADRVGRERMIATFLAQEGMEAARSIRDDNWESLGPGDHGLAVSEGNWVFQGTQENLGNKLNQGVRTITVQDIDSDRKQIISNVNWQVTEIRTNEVKLVSYLTQWKKPQLVTCQTLCEAEGYLSGSCKKAVKCDGLNLGEVGECAPPPPTTICCCQ